MLAHQVEQALCDSEGLGIGTQRWKLPHEARFEPSLKRADLPKPVHDDCLGAFFGHAGGCYASRQASPLRPALGVTLMPDPTTNVLYYGDNLDILRRYLPDACVDLVYLDPPVNSNRDYNVIFKDESGQRSDASMKAFAHRPRRPTPT